ncbi:hypothetical protein CcCBS67573_g05934 [Chytriomyces confervae]|uniref:Copper acquisition factor BIM1-like domain-containing protein n=1 Tax=Chytriomyces confervae TaxID=246404 RepID=A0A507F727_9FUNG|nr:hypothetical protein HDU80_003158 [Chytriomyces hyalinus]TPX72063.1 hypothetical protein CcCBS67573_g05934 [Chytriomyces confervae]
MQLKKAFLTAALAATSCVQAHFEMIAPPGRLLPSGVYSTGPCGGGADTPSPTRYDFALLNNSIGLIFYWEGDNEVFIGFGENPTTFPYRLGGAKSVGGDAIKVPLDMSSVPSDLLAKGGPATIQVVCHQPRDQNLYQCGDVMIKPSSAVVASTSSYSSSAASSAAASTSALYPSPSQTAVSPTSSLSSPQPITNPSSSSSSSPLKSATSAQPQSSNLESSACLRTQSILAALVAVFILI